MDEQVPEQPKNEPLTPQEPPSDAEISEGVAPVESGYEGVQTEHLGQQYEATSDSLPPTDDLSVPLWPQTAGEVADGESCAFDPEGAHPAGPKPLLSRLFNRIGIPTGRFMDGLLDWIQVLAVAAFLAWLTMSYVVVRMRVPTGSMEPTIHAGSSFFVDKLTFDLRQPIPGDIIVFWHNENSEKRVRYVKRMIASAGQTVQIKDCVKYPQAECGIYINGKKQRDKAFDRPYYSGGKMGEQVWTVPEGHYFALGDNSRNSLDGRFWGFVDAKDFIGEPFLRVWPLNQFGFMNRYFGSAP